MGKARARQGASYGVLFWIAAILLIAILFMVNLPSMRSVLDSTDFVEIVFEQPDADRTDGPPDDAAPQPLPVAPPATDTRDQLQPAPSGDSGEAAPGTDGTSLDRPPSADPQPQPQRESPDDATEEVVVLAPVERESAPESDTGRTARSTLYFIRVSDDGRILAEPVVRTITFGTSPLTRSVEALVAGPSADDLNRGLLSLIPSGTTLRSARVDSGVAYLDFSEEFRFNPMGVEGYLAQMQQVVRTATSFPTVDAVQILIEGERLSYLGGDGIYIGEPVRPEDFTTS